MEVYLDFALLKRAGAVLGVPGDADPDKIRYAYHCRMLKHHPDRNPNDPLAHEATALVGEAYAVVKGKIITPSLLLNEKLVRTLLENPVTELDDVPTYDEWLKDRFLNISGKSIWAYDED
ncbi:MAG: J domain-containing protein [Thermodesulfobacteriota bacterium]|nr:J domain-containing protein [Thermodesulfobacteriota bacterium]